MAPRNRSASPSPAGPANLPTVTRFRTWVSISEEGGEWTDIEGSKHVCPLSFLESPASTPSRLLGLALWATGVLPDSSRAYIQSQVPDLLVCSYKAALSQLTPEDYSSLSATLGVPDQSAFSSPPATFAIPDRISLAQAVIRTVSSASGRFIAPLTAADLRGLWSCPSWRPHLEMFNSKTFPVEDGGPLDMSIDAGLDVASNDGDRQLAIPMLPAAVPAVAEPSPPLARGGARAPSVPSDPAPLPPMRPSTVYVDRPIADDLLEPLGWNDGEGGGTSLGTQGTRTILRCLGESLSSVPGSTMSSCLYTLSMRCVCCVFALLLVPSLKFV